MSSNFEDLDDESGTLVCQESIMNTVVINFGVSALIPVEHFMRIR